MKTLSTDSSIQKTTSLSSFNTLLHHPFIDWISCEIEQIEPNSMSVFTFPNQINCKI